MKTHGYGNAASRYIVGTTDKIKELESNLAKFYNMEDCIVMQSCYDANSGLYSVLFDKEDVIFTDEFNHASSIDGIRLCKAKRVIFKHMDMAHLEEQLKKHQHCRMRCIVSDGVFAMHGDFSPYPEIVKLARKYNAIIHCDESHSTGLYGETGRGAQEIQGCLG